ncbi:hypothetical protein ACFV0T_38980 [Streptomyces sp. NPDC059582]
MTNRSGRPADPHRITLGLDTFGDVTNGSLGSPLSAACTPRGL